MFSKNETFSLQEEGASVALAHICLEISSIFEF